MERSKDVYLAFAKNITGLYDFAEAQSITKIIREDIFQNKAPSRLSKIEVSELQDIERQLISGVPLQYITGVADFYGLKIQVNSAVLIPRQDTESLVYEILQVAQTIAKTSQPRMIDIGTGSGCIALALKNEMAQAEITAVDVSIQALNVARSNSQSLNLCVQFEQLDILKETQWTRMGQYHIIVSNPPYIPPSERHYMPTYVKDQEPPIALFVAEEDPMLFYRKITAFATRHLAENGLLAFEVNEFRAKQVLEIVTANGFKASILKDLSGANRVVLAKK